jgi:hypothetical protein
MTAPNRRKNDASLDAGKRDLQEKTEVGRKVEEVRIEV